MKDPLIEGFIKGHIFKKPTWIRIETTSFCNAKCDFCPNSKMKRPQGVMSDKVFNRIIEQIRKIKPVRISPFLYGEMFLDKNILNRFRKWGHFAVIEPFKNYAGSIFDLPKAQKPSCLWYSYS